MEKPNLTPQKHAFTNQKKCTTTQNKHKQEGQHLLTVQRAANFRRDLEATYDFN